MRADDVTDPDWYIDNVVVPGGVERRPVGPVRARQGAWLASAHGLLASADDSPFGRAIRQAVGRGFVLARRQVRDAGVPDAEVRRLVRRGAWAPCGHGMITVLGTASAAVLHGLPVYEEPSLPESCAPTATTYGRLEQARVRFAEFGEGDLDDWFGVSVTSIARTVVDLARFDARSGLMAADAALHEGLVRAGEISAMVARSSGAPGIRRARAGLALASALIESPLESLTHLALHEDGFPPPQLQFPLVGADGKRYRADFAWPEFRLVLEADGRLKYQGEELWAEKGRELAIVRAGWRVVRLRWPDVARNWASTSAWLPSLMIADRSS